MAFLIGYDNICRAAKHNLELPSEEVLESFQAQVFDLISMAYNTIRTPGPIKENTDETLISIQLFHALKVVSSKEEIPLTIIIENSEITDQISRGVKRLITAKRYDILFESWNSKHPVVFGVEAKLLIENDFRGRMVSTLVREYVSEAGMGKYINGLYKRRGCMIGYIIEGNIPNIVEKINNQIEKVFNKKQCVKKDNSLKYKHKEIYKSQHKGNLNYDLYHLMLDFN